MMNLFDPLSIPLGRLMYFIYNYITFENYGFTLILFTILTRLLMLPLTIKQYQGTAKMQKLNPKLEELRRQFGTDKKRLQEETMKLYQQEKVNPAGGCLPLLIQFPILFSLYPVVTRPLRYMLGKTQEQIAALQDLYNTLSGNTRSFVQEMEVVNFFKMNPAHMAQAESANLLLPADFINMNFFGLDLSLTPTYSPDVLFGELMPIYLPLLLIPIIGVVSTYISGRISMASTAAQSTQNQQASSMSKSMQVLGPVMTLIFSFQLPAGVLVYWIAGYMIQIVQQLFINKYVLKLDNVFTGKSAATGARKRLPDKSGGTLPGTGAGNAGTGAGERASSGEYIGADGGVIAISGDAQAGGAQENLYDGGAMINRVISSLGGTGGTGGGKIKSSGSDGVVHGGVFETKYRIPGVTTVDDGSVPDSEDSGDRDGGGGESGDGEGVSIGGKDDADAGGANNAMNAMNAKNAPGATQQQRPRGGDTRSNTQKNYGTQKRKKKK
ncbi:MAG: YidC/Oxa1 family membrane protein insertase [Oscillospiraceae bacterium]|nr:YidC/Oxa1 family membrane protein insertase [Oscillospiraceae bacterium]